MDLIDVSIYEGSHLALQGRYSLPVKIGRHSDCDIRLPSPDSRISRFHAELSAQGRSLILTDESANGTRYRDRILSSTKTAIETFDEFIIEQYRVEVRRVQTAPSQPEPRHVHAAVPEAVVFFAMVLSRSRGELSYPIGPQSLVLHQKALHAHIGLVKPKTPDAILAEYARSGSEALAVIAAKDGFGTITTTPEALAHKLTINRGVPRGATERLNALDVVMVGSLRIELLEKGQRALRCKNLQCELLNPYTPDENCQYCGHKLVEAQTRVFG